MKKIAQRKFPQLTIILKTWTTTINEILDDFVKSHSSVARNPMEVEAGGVLKSEVIRDTRRTRASKST